jgi:hypothetical protein
MADDLISNMRERVARCRRLAEMIHDPGAIAILKQMAEEGEADIKRLEAEEARPDEQLDTDGADD